MTKIRDVFDYIDSVAPFDTQMDFDNSGFLVGDIDTQAAKVYVCLDATKIAVSRAQKLGCELIVSHHPAIYSPLRALCADSIPYLLAKSGTALISAHTNLDLAREGVNGCLANKLGLLDIQAPEGIDCGLYGRLKEAQTPEKFAKYASKCLGGVVSYNKGGRNIKTLGVLGGAGADIVEKLMNTGLDAVLTGELKHHLYIAARDSGITLFAAGHYETEQVVVEPLRDMLAAQFPDTVFIAESFESPTACERG